MNLELSKKQFRRLLDLVYIGNWILNSTRGDQRFADYDQVESLLFGRAALEGMPDLAELYQGGGCSLQGLCGGRHPRGHH